MTAGPSGEPDASGPLRPSGALVVCAALVLGWGAAAGPHPWDAGELAAAAVRLGGSHAPGQPLHALVGWAATHLIPLGPMPWRLSLLSTALAAGAAYAAGAIAGELLPARASAPSWRAPLVVNATAVGVLIAPPILRQAARPEVYALAILLFALAALAVVRWARPGGRRSARTLLPAALAGGLGFAVHPPHALAIALFGLALVAAWRRDALRSPRALGLSLVFAVAGLAVLAYLPLRAWAGAPMWGEPTSLDGFVTYVSGRAYRMNMPGPGGASSEAPLGVAARMALVQGGGVPVLALLGAGVTWLVGRARRAPTPADLAAPLVLGAAAALVLLSATLFTPDERIPDHVAYLAPTVLVSIVAGALALDALFAARPTLAAPALVALALVPTALPDLPGRLVADVPALESFGFALVDAPPPRALALVRTDFVAATWMMDAAIDRTRPDVGVFVEGLATSSWHWRSLAGHPACPEGEPTRAGPGSGPEPWIRGLFAAAASVVPIAAEEHASLASLAWVDGPYLRTPPRTGGADHRLRATGGSGERALALVATTLAWARRGDHDVAAEIVRAAVVTRAVRLFARGEVDAAREAITLATAPLPAAGLAPLRSLDAPPRRPLVPALEDPEALYTTAEDAVRVGATMLHSAGRRAEASALLEAQLDRGDLRAMLELAWLLLSDGAIDQARDIVDLYVATSPENAADALPLIEAIARVSTAAGAGVGADPTN